MSCASAEEQVVEILKGHSISLAATLPCDRLKCLLPLIKENFRTISLTREENGVGICAGYYMGGGLPCMVIQSTGLGNMLNALMSLNVTYDIPLPIIASWRGIYKEGIPAQVPLGKALPGILEASGIRYTIIHSSEELGRLNLVISDAFDNQRPHVALMVPSVWDQCPSPAPPQNIEPRTCSLEFASKVKIPSMSRYEVISSLASILEDEVIISNIGVPSKELYHIRDRPLNFYMLGSMGLASAIGLGIAMVQDRQVVVIDGDGSLLMNPNILTQVAAQWPENLIILAVDNGAYGSTGHQQTLTCRVNDLELMARGHGIQYTTKTHTNEELLDTFERMKKAPGPGFIHAVVRPVNVAVGEIPLKPAKIKERFMAAVLMKDLE